MKPSRSGLVLYIPQPQFLTLRPSLCTHCMMEVALTDRGFVTPAPRVLRGRTIQGFLLG